MITLQSTFAYANGEEAPIDSIPIAVAFPQYVFSEKLISAGSVSVVFEQQLSKKVYHVPIPTSKLFGADYGPTVAKYFTSLLKDGQKIRLDDVSVPFTFSYGGDAVDGVELEALYFIKAITRPDNTDEQRLQRTTATMLSSQTHVNQAQLIDSNIYAVNKRIYLEMLNSLFSGIAAENESILLYIINVLVDLTGESPRLLQTQSDGRIDAILRYFDWEPDDAPAIRKVVMENFSKLFDFPLRVPELKLLKIAGKVQIDAEQVQAQDFTLCDLSAEFITGGQLRTIHYQWDKQGFQRKSWKFTFPEEYIVNSIVGKVTIKVAAYDNTGLYAGTFKPSDPILQKLDITIVPKLPSVLKPPVTRPSKPTKLRGQIVSLSPKPRETLQGIVVVQAKKDADEGWVTVSTAMSDKLGNFSMPYPSGKYVGAQALVSLDPESSTVIAIKDKSIASDFVYILLRDSVEESEKKDDCKCEQTTNTARLPSQDDLIQSDQFTQDIGGACMTLNTPNRTLQEYNYQALVRTSDPDVANYSIRSVTDNTGSRTFLKANHGKVTRGLIDMNNPVRWHDDDDEDEDEVKVVTHPWLRPSVIQNPIARPDLIGRKKEVSTQLYQAVTVATGHILHYKSEFKADGYSLGDLLYSVPLAPGQKKQIVILDSSHSFTGSENQNIGQAESLANSLLSERSIVDQIAGNVGEAVRGSSDATTWGVSAAVGASGSTGFIGASAGVAGGYSNANSSASQDSNRNLSQYFGEMLKQGLSQNANSYRKLTASAVTTVKEGQQYNAETTAISNHNHCHSLTMMYFEVLRHFAVFQELVDVEECVFVPFLMTKFTNANVSKYADVLITKLLPLHSNTYLTPYTHPNSPFQHPLAPAFDAIERIRTKYTMVDYPVGSYDQEPIRKVEGNLVVHVDLPRPKTKYDFIMSLPIVTKTISREVTDAGDLVKSAVVAIFNPFSLFDGPESHTVTEEIQVKKQIFDNFMTLDANYATVPPAQCIRIHKFVQFNLTGLFSGNMNPFSFLQITPSDMDLWAAYAHCLEYTPGSFGILKMMEDYFQGQLLSEWDTIFQSEIAPRAFKFMVSTIKFDVLPVTMTVDTKYNGGERYINVPFSGHPSTAKRALIDGFNVYCKDEIVKDIKESIIFNVQSLRVSYSTNHYHGLLFNGNPNADILTGWYWADCPENWEEKRDPRKEDVFIANRLVEHLNYNLEYYNRVLWYSLDADRRWLLLDGFQIQVFDKEGRPEQPNSYRSLASIVKNNLIAVAGNSLVFPVAPGFRVNRSLVMADNAEREESLLDYYKPAIPTPPYRLSVPTRGVYMESVMGGCDSCEKLKPDSSQDWTKFPVEEPTTIAQVTPPVPTVTPYQAAFEKLASPLISLQSAPAAPDPGAGLAAATDLLGKSGMFKDITGLDANQANAIKTYLSNQENVRAIASMASGLAGQAHNTANSAMIMDTMTSANDKGVLSDEDYGKLVKQHLQQQIDGGATLKADLESQKSAQNPSLEEAAVQAVKDGREVQAVKSDSDGATQSISVKSLFGEGADGGGGGSTDGFSVGNGDDWVGKFKTVFAKNESIFAWGQFQITMAVATSISKIVEDSLDQAPHAGLQDIWDGMEKDVRENPDNHANNMKLKQFIDANHMKGQYKAIDDLYETYRGPSVKKLFWDFWTPLEVLETPVIQKPTFGLLEEAYRYDSTKCGFDAALMARKFVKATVNANAADHVLARQKLEKTIQVRITPRLEVGDTRQQIFEYPDDLEATLQLVRQSIRDGRPVVAGVMSGINHVDSALTPFKLTSPLKCEHYILIIGFDENRFFFWDSDATRSNIASKKDEWGPGFGVLFGGNGRFGTAYDETDLKKLETKGILEGDHVNEKRRHCYQVYYLRNYYHPIPTELQP